MLVPTLIAQFGSGGFQPVSPLVEDAAVDPAANLELIISNVIGFLTILGGIYFVIYFLIAAMEWVGSGGDSGKLTSARNRMLHGVLGLIILVATYAIIGLIGSIVGIDILNPAEQLQTIIPGGTP